MEESIVKIDDSGWSALVGQGVTGDTGASVGVDEGLVEVCFFVGGEADLTGDGSTKHETKETVQGDEVGAEGVVGVFVVDDFGKIKRINTDVGIETEPDVATANGIAEFLVLIFGVDNDDFGTDHHRADSFKLDSERLTSAGFSKDDKIGVFKAETIENN